MISPGLVLSNLHNLDLGYHDGEAFTIVLANHEDPELFAITAHHEFLHHVLITGTTLVILCIGPNGPVPGSSLASTRKSSNSL